MGSGLAFKHSGSVIVDRSLTELTECTEKDFHRPFATLTRAAEFAE